MAPKLGFGCELEMSAEPRVWKNLSRAEKIKRLVRELRNHHLSAKPLSGSPSKYDRWWITDDVSISLANLSPYAIRMECVSPVTKFDSNWQDDMQEFWSVLTGAFKVTRNDSCGTHVHIAPWKKNFTIKQAQTVAFACCLYEPYVVSCLPDNRRTSRYCQRNSRVEGLLLKTLFERKSMSKIAAAIKRKKDFKKLRDFMQGDNRYVLWNFKNLPNKRKSTIEFRGGQHAQDADKAECWITFAVVFVMMALKENLLFSRSTYRMADNDSYDEVQRFWKRFTDFARTLDVGDHFPFVFKKMSERWRE
ncbi:hypothetical protein M501DRAFT_1002208 [Patellaria atrata CBS 101060]|uniref:Amidoligase enzyme n=1 Tax=Patellaria atrata CBS 101060 TaxID=1346257 RepID=A0A9P4VIK1_9PEZI|nr:hypothetical protein M501DRAFT_1002208 [Patellaria atrata CBS 101060]